MSEPAEIHGYLENGRFTPIDPIPITDRRMVKVIYMDEVLEQRELAKRQLALWEKFFAAIDAIEDEPLEGEPVRLCLGREIDA